MDEKPRPSLKDLSKLLDDAEAAALSGRGRGRGAPVLGMPPRIDSRPTTVEGYPLDDLTPADTDAGFSRSPIVDPASNSGPENIPTAEVVVEAEDRQIKELGERELRPGYKKSPLLENHLIKIRYKSWPQVWLLGRRPEWLPEVFC